MKLRFLAAAAILSLALSACTTNVADDNAMKGDSSAPAVVSEVESITKPTDGWGLHIDAKRHFTDELTDPIAHHYCKNLTGGVTQCMLFTSDAADAQLVGVEVIVGPDVYAAFSGEEKKSWHYHKDEIPRVEPVLPDVSEEEAGEIAKSIEETYGKVYILRNPSKTTGFTGNPYVSILSGED